MKKLLFISMAVGILLVTFNGSALAITFSEAPLGIGDPLINSVQFFAGDPATLNDTYIDDAWIPGNPYLASGYEFTNAAGTYYDTFIGASAQDFLFADVTLDIWSEYQLPPSTNLTVQALLNGTVVDNITITVADWNAHSLSVSYATGFDSVYIFDDHDDSGFGEAFHIDNFIFTKNDSAPVPEPATILLLSVGLAGIVVIGKKKKVS